VWELLDDGAEYTAIMPWRSRAQYNCFFNGRLFRLKPNRDEVIDELEIVDFSLPDDLEELQRARNRKEENEDTIEISDVRLSQSPPPRAIQSTLLLRLSHGSRLNSILADGLRRGLGRKISRWEHTRRPASTGG
jgi:hypothetical protein